jgi:hypothetical protein
MTRRAGIVALLTSVGSASQNSTVASGFMVPTKAARKLVLLCGGEYGFESIEVRMGAETITLSAQEIMDALAGRVKLNHCPKRSESFPAVPMRLPIRERYLTEEEMLADKGQPYGELSRCSRCRAAFWRE